MRPKRLLARAAACLLICGALPAHAQVIDFEHVPSGPATTDQQTISTEYSSYGVTFTLLDRVTGLPIGFPRIAKAGLPLTAFEGCSDADTPRPGYGLGSSFLTDGVSAGVQGDVRIEYATAVAEASGVILDIDCRTNGGPPCEQWTVTAYDAGGGVLQTIVLDAPAGAPNPTCLSPDAGPGDALPVGWTVSAGSPVIKSIVLRYTGAATGVGLAFDNFSVASLPGPPDVSVFAAADSLCGGESTELTASIAGGVPPYAFQWEQEAGPGTWSPLGTAQTQTVHPGVTTRYRVRATDALGQVTTSTPRTVVVTGGNVQCNGALLVGCFDGSKIVRFGMLSHQSDVLVPSGQGGLNGTADVVCRGDGKLYAISQTSNQVLRFDATTGAFLDVFVTAASGGLSTPTGMTFGPDGHLYVSSSANDRVLSYDGADGSFRGTFVAAGSGGLNVPTGLTFGPDGHLYVSSRDTDAILRYDGTTGAFLGAFVATGGGGLDAPRGLAFGPGGDLYVGEEAHDSVRRYDGTTGAALGVFVTAGAGGLDRANDLAFGPDGRLYIASYNSNQVLAYDAASGAFLYALPSDDLDGPVWLAVGCGFSTLDAPAPAGGGARLALAPSAPNPFRGRTRIEFTLPVAGPASVTVVDVAGRVVATLAEGTLAAGRHTLTWDARSDAGIAAAPGAYFVRIRQGGELRGQKLLLVQ